MCEGLVKEHSAIVIELVFKTLLRPDEICHLLSFCPASAFPLAVC